MNKALNPSLKYELNRKNRSPKINIYPNLSNSSLVCNLT